MVENCILLCNFFTFIKGRDGRAGTNGLDGKDGRPGIDGQKGANGTRGFPGVEVSLFIFNMYIKIITNQA